MLYSGTTARYKKGKNFKNEFCVLTETIKKIIKQYVTDYIDFEKIDTPIEVNLYQCQCQSQVNSIIIKY